MNKTPFKFKLMHRKTKKRLIKKLLLLRRCINRNKMFNRSKQQKHQWKFNKFTKKLLWKKSKKLMLLLKYKTRRNKMLPRRLRQKKLLYSLRRINKNLL